MTKGPNKYVYYFCDESSQIDDPYMAVGGLAVPDTVVEKIRDDLSELKEKNGCPREVKWSNTKDRRDCPSRAFADYFEAAVKAKQIHFHIRFAPFGQYDHRISGPLRRADTTSKMHFQLLVHRAIRHYGRHYKLRIRPDNGDCTKALPGQIGNLHWTANDRYGTPMDCVDHIQCLNSENELLLQLLDIPLGAFSALRNERVLGPAKAALAQHIRDKWPALNLRSSTDQSVCDFSVWNVRPSGPPRRGPWG